MELNVKVRGLLGGIGVVLLALGCSRQSAAQAAAGVYADVNNPSGAPDPEKLNQIWQVDPITGSVSITIPFTTTPAGGRGPKIPFTLHYNSSSTVTLQYNYTASTEGDPTSTQVYGWSTGQIHPINTDPPQSPLGPWTTSGPFFYGHGTIIPGVHIRYDLPTGPVWVDSSGCSIGGPFIYTDASGSAHDMNLETTTTTNSPGYVADCTSAYSVSLTYGSNYFTTDGSALATTLSPMSVVQPDGTQVSETSQGPTLLEDSNGNQATFGLNAAGNAMTATDSLGRTAFSTTIPIDHMGQIPVGTYNVTTTGASGNSESYSVAFSQISIGSFTMPHPVSGPVASPTSDMTGSDTSLGVEQPATEGVNTTLPVVSSITLPDSTQYSFTYDSTYGTISRIEFPTGGYVRFVWGIRGDGVGNSTFSRLSTLVATAACTSSGSGAESCWQYSFPDYSSTTGLTSTVIAPDGSYTNYTGVGVGYSAAPISRGGNWSWKEASRLEYSSTNKLLKSVATTYGTANSNAGLTTQVATTLYDGPTPLQQYVQYLYDNYGYANVVEKDESGFNQCTGTPCSMPTTSSLPSFLRKTFTSYAYSTSNPAFLNAHIVDKPHQVLITDGVGHPYSLTQYGYDETPVTGQPGLTNHDDTSYSISNNVRGNLTRESHCSLLDNAAIVTIANASSACLAWVKTTHTYDLTGQVKSSTDPNQNTTLFSYACNNGYVETVTHPYGFVDTYSYYCPTGQVASHKDWNNQTTTYLYNDPGNMHRPTEIQYPDGGDVQIGYVDTPPFSVTTTTTTGETSGPIVKTTLYDGLGRTYQTQVSSDPSGTDYVDTTYDLMGRVQSVTNPYRTTSDPTYGITSYRYDPLGRKIDQCQPDNSLTPSTVCVPTNSYQSWAYNNNSTSATSCVLSQDENKNHWQRCSNGLGLLMSVLEPNGASSSSTMETDYTYDVLNNLLSATQCGATCPGTNARVRSFTYDSLSRLLTSSNPETGTVCYGLWSGATCMNGYDGDGNLQHKTDARGVITSYAYDQLNRVISKSYSNDPSQTPFTYYLYGPLSAGDNASGRLINEWTQSASPGLIVPKAAPTTGFYTMRSIGPNNPYDPMGRILNETQFTVANQAAPYTLAYTYDLAGNLLTSTSGAGPSGPITFTNTYDGAGRLQKLASNYTNSSLYPDTLFSPPSAQSIPCANSFTTQYTPFGGLANAGLGNGLSLNRSFDNRLRTTCETDTGSIVTSSTPGSATVTITGLEQSK
jgi:YD repeat-containing protein